MQLRFKYLLAGLATLITTSAQGGYFDCSVVYDEFESLMNNRFLTEPDRFVPVNSGPFHLRDYEQQQKGKFTLYPERAELGVIVFRTNENLHGKMLYRFSDVVEGERHLILEEVVVFARVADGYAPSRYGPVRLKPKNGIDLDSGQTFLLVEGDKTAAKEQAEQAKADLGYFIDTDSGEPVIAALNQSLLQFPLETLCYRPGAATPSPSRSTPPPPRSPAAGVSRQR